MVPDELSTSLTRIDKAIIDGEFLTNEALVGAYDHTTENDSALHLFGLLSDGGVHSHVSHIIALIKGAKEKASKLYLHAFLDGRDVDPHAAPGYIETVEKRWKKSGWAKSRLFQVVTTLWTVTTVGNVWNWHTMQSHTAKAFESAQAVVEASYADGKTDGRLADCHR